MFRLLLQLSLFKLNVLAVSTEIQARYIIFYLALSHMQKKKIVLQRRRFTITLSVDFVFNIN